MPRLDTVRTRVTNGESAVQNLVVVSAAGHQLVNLVLVPSEVVADLPVPVFRLYGAPSSSHLDTGVVQRADVAGHLVREVGSHGNHNRVDQVLGLTMIEVEVQGQTVVQDSEVQTGIPCGGLLPSQCVVVGIRTIGAAIAVEQRIVSALFVGCICRNIRIVADSFLLTGDTPACAQLQVRKPFGVLQERLVVDFPSQGHGWEQAPLLVFAAVAGDPVEAR